MRNFQTETLNSQNSHENILATKYRTCKNAELPVSDTFLNVMLRECSNFSTIFSQQREMNGLNFTIFFQKQNERLVWKLHNNYYEFYNSDSNFQAVVKLFISFIQTAMQLENTTIIPHRPNITCWYPFASWVTWVFNELRMVCLRECQLTVVVLFLLVILHELPVRLPLRRLRAAGPVQGRFDRSVQEQRVLSFSEELH